MVDSLATYDVKSNGLFLRVDGGTSVKIRVLTLDPGVVESSGENSQGEKWSSTKYGFIVWNWDEDKAQYWTTTPGVLKQLTNIHRDEDLDALNKLDVKVSATGEMLEKRYSVMPLPKSGEITKKILEEAKTLDISSINGYKGRLSELMDSEESEKSLGDEYRAKQAEKAVTANEEEDEVIEDIGDEPMDISAIPF